MQSLGSNMQTIYYALYEGLTDTLDKSGYKTGAKSKVYSVPQPFRVFVSPNKGDAEVQPFGIETQYTNVATTFDLTCPIKEDSILWVGVTPDLTAKGGGNVPYTHSVIRRAKAVNSLLFALKEVEVTCTPLQSL